MNSSPTSDAAIAEGIADDRNTPDNMEREHFKSTFGVLVAMAGSAIGLGNLWRFPYMVGVYGGSAFIFVYIVFTFLLCLPILFAEIIIGRRSHTNAFRAFEKLAPGTKWKWVGILMVATPIIVVSYYSVIGGWSLEYLFKACTFSFTGGASREELGMIFNSFITSTWAPLLWHLVFLLLTVAVVLGGVNKGIEKFGKIMMPVLFITVIAIAIRSITLPGAAEGLKYLFSPDFSKITPEVCAAALGQGFFSLSVGFGIILTYGSYTRKEENIAANSTWTAVADLVFALIASCAIMPAVFAFGLNPQEGPGLVFETLPFIFANMPLGGVIAILFFIALLVAALTSSVSLVEVGVAWLVEEKHLSRKASVWTVFAVIWVLGILCSLSFGRLSGITIFGNSIFNFFDKLSAGWLMPIGALLIVLFAGWKMKRKDVLDEFTNGGSLKGNLLVSAPVYFLIRYIAPLAIIVIFLTNLLK